MDVLERRFPITLVVASTGAPPLATAPADDPTPEPWVDADGRVYGCSFAVREWCHVRIDGVGSFAFTTRSGRVHGRPEAGASRERLRDAFYRQVVPFVLQRQSWEVLHASGLVVAGAGVALCGDSQMGKSTLADAWRRRGGAVFADDALPFRVEQDGVRLRPIPFRLRPRTPLERVEQEEPLPRPLPYEERGDLARSRCGYGSPLLVGEGLGEGFLRAIGLLDRRPESEGPVQLEPVAPADALDALLQQAYWLTLRDRRRNRRMVEQYMALANAVPAFRLSYPSNVGRVEAILLRLSAHVRDELLRRDSS